MIGHLLNDEVTVWRQQRTPDGMGGYTATREQVGTGPVRCRLPQPSTSEDRIASRPGGVLTSPVYFAADADVRRGDELRGPGRPYRVTATVAPSTSGVYLRADCERTQTRRPDEDE